MQARRSAVCVRASRSCRSRSSSSASARTTSSRSIAPRTEAPRARSGCTRVARVMATAARSSHRGASGACTRTTVRSSRARRCASRRRTSRSPNALLSGWVPVVSSSFTVAITPNPGAAVTSPTRGTTMHRSPRGPRRTLRVSGGSRLASSRCSNRPWRIATISGPSTWPAAENPVRSTAAGSWWPSSAAPVTAALPSTTVTGRPTAVATSRTRIDLPVPAGPSMSRSRPARRAAISVRRSTRRPTRVITAAARRRAR